MHIPPGRLKLSRYSGSDQTWSLGGSGKNALFKRSFNHCSKLAATTLTLSGPFILPCCIGFLPVAAIEPPNVGSEDYLIPGPETLELHHLYRAMAFLGQEIESKGQKTLGSPRCLKDLIEEVYFPRKNGHVILGFFALLSKESGESVPRTPWVFSLCPCSGGDRPWAGGLPVGGRTRRLQGCIGARGASPQSSSLRCNIDSLG